MLLAIDVGNTNIVFGCLKDGKVVDSCRMETLRQGTADEFAAVMTCLLRRCGWRKEELRGAVLSSVVPEVDQALKRAVKQVTGLDCLMVTPRMEMGMTIAIDQPETLAADLISGCVGALQICQPPVAVVDMGTATTVVVVDGQRRYRGGAIMAGVHLSLSALVAGTSLLPDLSIEAPEKCISANTVDCMQSGAVYGTAAMLDGMLQRMEDELGEPMATVITGGLGGCIAPHCRRAMQYEPDLLFRGMAALYDMQQGNKAK